MPARWMRIDAAPVSIAVTQPYSGMASTVHRPKLHLR